MFRRPSIPALVILLAACCRWSGYAQFARAPQDSGAGQYPSYSNAPDNSGLPPSEPAPDTVQDQQHGAARISVVQGDVNVRRGDTSELVAAALNAPLVGQDRLQTAEGSRGEVELDSANLIRLAPNTDLGVGELRYRRFQIQLGAGTILYRVLRSPQSQGEVDTPNIALRALGEGAFRVAVLDDGTTRIDVRAGTAEIAGPRGSERIEAGQAVLVRGNPADPEFQEVPALGRDQFDDWNEGRDRELLSSQSYGYVSPDISGAEDLDANGAWVPSQYGQVWTPRTVAQDWSPYSDGQWNWEPYYGWTWVDYAPWGWAPYHYGRWFWNSGYGWCWWPGARLSAHFWSPALVGFFGWRNGSIGWAALAPYERFRPWWGRGAYGGYRGYGPGFGFNAGILSSYRNAGFRGGAVYAGYNAFGGPHGRFGFATREQLGSASFFRGQMPVGPSRAGYLFTSRQAVVNSRFQSVSNPRFFQSTRPRWTSNSYGVARQNGYPVRSSGVNPGRSATGGWQRFGDSGTSTQYRQGFAGSTAESGWHQFGRPQQESHSVRQSTPSYRQTPSFSAVSPYERSARPYSNGGSTTPQGHGFNDYGGSRGNYRASPYSGSAVPRYSPPSQPHYSAPSSRGGGGAGSFHGGEAPRGGGGQHYSSGSGRRSR